MYGKLAVASALFATLLAAAMQRGTPGSPAPRYASLVAPEFFDRAGQPDIMARLKGALAKFDGYPSTEMAGEVIDAFAALDEHVADLRERASKVAGGRRAELEIRRIEMERERDLQLERFEAASQRVSFRLPRPAGGRQMNFALTSSLGGLPD